MKHDLREITEKTAQIAALAGEYILSERQKFSVEKVEVKSLNSLVSYVDRTAEEMLVEGLSKLVPEAGFITEEETVENAEKEFTWIIDPLDGTTNFIHGIPCFAVSVALLRNREPVSGVIYEVNLKESFTAWEDGPALLNGNPMRVSATEEMKTSLIATGFPYYDYGRLDPYLDLFSHLMKTTRGLRRLGSAATDLAYVAAGRFEGFYEYGLNPWDIAAGVLLVERAGGKVTDFRNGRDFLFGKEIIATNGKIHHELFDSVSSCFGSLSGNGS